MILDFSMPDPAIVNRLARLQKGQDDLREDTVDLGSAFQIGMSNLKGAGETWLISWLVNLPTSLCVATILYIFVIAYCWVKRRVIDL